MTRKLIILVVVAVVAIAAAGVGGYVFFTSPGVEEAIVPPEPPGPPEPPPGPTQIFILKNVSSVSGFGVQIGTARATWQVWNPSDSIVGVFSILALFEADWGELDPNVIDIRFTDRVMPCTNVGPGQTVLVDQEFSVWKFSQDSAGAISGRLFRGLDEVTDWQSGGGLAEFTEGGCGTGGRTLCAVVVGGIFENSCGDQPTLEP